MNAYIRKPPDPHTPPPKIKKRKRNCPHSTHAIDVDLNIL
jgi:hypothetical protein